MPIYYRKRVRVGKNARVNLTKTGASGTVKLGPVSVNSRGRVTIRFGKGLFWRAGR